MDTLDDRHRRELRAHAKRYLDRGWKLVRLRQGTKLAFEKDWPSLERTAEDFQHGDNIGVRFGPESGGLVDVDLDYETARVLVSRPVFGLDHLIEFGRASLPVGRRGHRLVVVPDAPNRSRPFTIRTKAGTALLAERGLKPTVLEIRGGNGSQTAFPPSVITGKDGADDLLVWSAGDVPEVIPEMSWHELNRRVGLLAFAALAAAVYPADDRFAFCLHLLGALTEAGVAEPAASEMATEVARAAGDQADVGVLATSTEDLASFLDLVGLGGIEHIVRNWLGMEARAAAVGTEAQRDLQPGQIDADQLRRLLDGLDPCDFPGYYDHLSIVLAAHHASAGFEAAREAVVEWSARNPDYGPGMRDEHGKLWADVVRSHWRNARLDRPDGYTLGTIIHHLREAGQGALVAEVLGASSVEVFANAPVDPQWDASISTSDRLKALGVEDYPALKRPENVVALARIHLESPEEFERIKQHWREAKVRAKDIDSVEAAAVRRAKQLQRNQQPSGHDVAEPGVVVLEKKKPLEAARLFISAKCPNLIQHIGEWLDWDGAGYVSLEDRTVRQQLQRWLETTQMLDLNLRTMQPELGPTQPTATLIGGIVEVLANEVHVEMGRFDPPCWLDSVSTDPPAKEVLACRNGLLHVPTGRFMDPTPRFFTRTALDFAYDPDAPEPRHWLAFLDQVYAGLPDHIALLQEAFGYLLLPDTSKQVIFLRVAPSRGGKGTEIKILVSLLGSANCTSQMLKQMGERFGLQSAIDKLLLTVTDAYVTRAVNPGEVAQTLLRISGEDPMTIERKNIQDWQGRLPVRIWVAATEELVLPDMSGALINRYVPIVSFEDFVGKEDQELEGKLMAELPGILNWAIEGRRRLMKQGRFTQTAEGRKLVHRIEFLTNPVKPFLRECCVIEAGARIRTQELIAAFTSWAPRISEGFYHTSEEQFGRWLALAGKRRVTKTHPRTGPDGQQEPWYSGVRLKTEAEMAEF